jgi:magnesium transporter
MLIVRPDGSIVPDVSEGELTRAYSDHQGIVWLNYAEPPDPEQLAFLTNLFDFGEGAGEHLTELHRGPRATPLRAYMLIVVYDVSLPADAKTIDRSEVVLLFTNRSLVTVHRNPSAALSLAAGPIERALDRFGIEVAAIVYAILEAIADEYLRVLDAVKTRVDALEVRVLQQEEQEGIGELYQLRRQLTQLRSVLAPEAALIGMRAGPNPFIGNADMQDAMLDVKHKMQCAVDEIDQYLAMLPDILTTFESLKSDNLNQIVKLLTVWSIILTAVALFPSVLGISLAREPSISPYVGYVVSLVAMVVVGWLVWYAFRRRGWMD